MSTINTFIEITRPAPKGAFAGADTKGFGQEGSPCVVGVLYEGLSVSGKGTISSPRVIREVSQEFAFLSCPLPPGYPESTDYFDRLQILRPIDCVDLGDIGPFDDDSIQEATYAIDIVSKYIQQINRVPLFLGGNHSLLYYAVAALDDPNIVVVHFDAHLDNAPSERPNFPDNGSCVGELLSRGCCSKVITIGLRGFFPEVRREHQEKHKVVSRSDLLNKSTRTDLFEIKKGCRVWISFDIDVLDPSIAPATNSPVVNGLFIQDVLEIISFLCNNFSIVGADFVELVPAIDSNLLTARSLVMIIIELIISLRQRSR